MELTKTNERAVALERKVENLEQIFNTAEKIKKTTGVTESPIERR